MLPGIGSQAPGQKRRREGEGEGEGPSEGDAQAAARARAFLADFKALPLDRLGPEEGISQVSPLTLADSLQHIAGDLYARMTLLSVPQARLRAVLTPWTCNQSCELQDSKLVGGAENVI